jgi:hypothetical protein
MEFFGLVLFLLILFFYFIPAYVAGTRRAENSGAITAINLLFGWTVIGWFGALIWACTDKQRPAPEAKPQAPAEPNGNPRLRAAQDRAAAIVAAAKARETPPAKIYEKDF